MSYTYKQQVILCDIDGTLSDLSHRLFYLEGRDKDYDTFYSLCHLDKPIVPVCKMVRQLMGRAQVIFVTGRPEAFREKTEKWLTQQCLKGRVEMRKNGDYRADYVIKKEILDKLKGEGLEPTLAIEDRRSCVDMYRREGLICLQAKEGDY